MSNPEKEHYLEEEKTSFHKHQGYGQAAGPSRAGARGPTTHSPSPPLLLLGGGPAAAQFFYKHFHEMFASPVNIFPGICL